MIAHAARTHRVEWALVVAIAAGVWLWVADGAAAQRSWGWPGSAPVIIPERDIFPDNRFTFCRIRYTSYGERPRSNYGRWSIDYPQSDEHFSWRLSELTTVNVRRDKDGGYYHVVIDLTDEALFDYPFIYMLEVGNLVFSEAEVEALRSYLLRGGFLMVDDFWGEREWANWVMQIARVFDPEEYRMKELPLSHPIFNCVFVLDEKPQVPNPGTWSYGGNTSERGAESATPHYKGIHDKNGRLMVVVCHNTDLGDGWEREGWNEDYFREISVKKAYPMGINIVVYALTH
ncbi:MAG: DUF4159 domain-containing protein [Candidatus Hydrogenedentes bacterium]|nr:DUF4159 domain-containing protein [Candidatus Hydrogenedentota bacterium]